MSDSPADSESLDINPMTVVDFADIPRVREPDQPEAAKPEPAVNDKLLARASEYGFTSDDIEGLGDKLESALDRIEAKSFERYRAFKEQQIPRDVPPQGWQQPVQPPVQQQGTMPTWPVNQTTPWQANQVGTPQQQAPVPQPFEIKLDPSEYDEVLVDTLQKMNQHYQQQMAQVTASLQQQEAFVYNQLSAAEEQVRHETSTWFDRSVSELGDDFEPVFGKGRYEQLPQGSQQIQMREQVWRDYVEFLEWKGLPLTTRDDELLSRLVRTRVGSVPTIQQKQLSEQLKRGASRTIGRPAGRRSEIDSVINPETGLPQSDLDELQRMLDEKRSV